MSAKSAIFVVIAQALLIQSALSQVCGRAGFAGLGSYGLAGPALTSPFGYNGLASGLSGNGCACNGLAGNSLAYDSIYIPAVEITPTTGGGLPVTSASAIAPNSLVVASENVYEGTLAVGGDLPFVGTVGLEGVLPTAGSGAVNHACGNGATRMVSQDGAAIASGFGTGFGSGAAFGNMYGGISTLGNAAAVAPFGCGSGLGGLPYPAANLASAYPSAGFTGAYPATSLAGAYPTTSLAGAYPATSLAGAYPAAGFGAGLAAYGGTGEGNVAVAGELPVAGTTAVAGQVPIMGAVSFDGNVPAAGAVTMSGKCACGCGRSYMY